MVKVAQKSIAHSSGVVSVPLRVVTLEQLDVDRVRFVTDIAPTFDDLPDDAYDQLRRQHAFVAAHGPIDRLAPEEQYAYDRIAAGRRRAVAVFNVSYQGAVNCTIEQVPSVVFVQSVAKEDYRREPRVFVQMHAFVTNHPEFRNLLKGVARLVAETVQMGELKLRVVVHQMMSMARRSLPADNAPEGIHQDGADYIISALVVEERGVRGGMSKVYWRDPETGKDTILLQHDLAVGEGIFQADAGSALWHDVSPVNLAPGAPYAIGTRSIFGFDIQLVRSS